MWGEGVNTFIPDNVMTDDTIPTLSGILGAALGVNEEVALYNGASLLGVAMVDTATNTWSFIPNTPLINDTYSLRAVIQAQGVTDITQARVISDVATFEVDASIIPTATITEVVDDESTNGSMIGALTEEGVTTDDTTPTLSGVLSAPLTDGQVIAIYDGDTLLGYTTVTGGLSWSFTPDTELQAGLHTLKAQVENVGSGQTSTADSFDVIVNPTIAITNIFDDVGDITSNNNLLVRYVMLYQNVLSPRLMLIGEVEVLDANGENIALNKAITVKPGTSFDYPQWSGSQIVDGKIDPNDIISGGFLPNQETIDTWVQIDLGDYYDVAQVNFHEAAQRYIPDDLYNDIGIFLSAHDMAGKTYAELEADDTAELIGITHINNGDNVGGGVNTFTLDNVMTDDTTPTFSGILGAALGVNEEVALYNGASLLGVAMVDTATNTWSFIPNTPLIDDIYSLRAVIQAQGVTDITQARVISDVATFEVDASVPPLVIDLDGDGIDYISLKQSYALYDVDGDGDLEKTAWFGPYDALLAYDENGDGQISGRQEIVLKDYVDDAKTDLDGMRYFDTNDDNVFDQQDEQWGSFSLWQDKNGDGVSNDSELFTLLEAGIQAIELTSDNNKKILEGGSVIEHGQFTVHRVDGTQTTGSDVEFAIEEIIFNAEVL